MPDPTPPLYESESRDEFFDYYADASLSPETLARYSSIFQTVTAAAPSVRLAEGLTVADIGCGAGTQSMLWARHGHHAHGLDVNRRLIDLGAQRAKEQGLSVTLVVGSATSLPWESRSMDVCLLPELLEHVPDWKTCLDEATRVLKPGGILFLTTTNRLCPIQQEFTLPLYSWYPTKLKNHFVKLATTTRPKYANFATYPAVNWFTFYDLRRELVKRGFRAFDKFDTTQNASSQLQRYLLSLIRRVPIVRFLAHVATPYTQVVAIAGPRSESLAS